MKTLKLQKKNDTSNCQNLNHKTINLVMKKYKRNHDLFILEMLLNIGIYNIPDYKY